MGFMDKAKEAAEDLKASFATSEVRDSEQAYRDLGMIAYLTTTGRPIDEADRQRLVNTLWALEQQAKLPPFRLVTSPPPPPPPPPPVPQAAPPAAPPAAAPPPAPAAPAAPPAPPAPAAPPDPPTPAAPPAPPTPPPPTDQPPA
ncbi:MAG TPA: hypothetical protein VFQ17_01785 [Nocardioides sp.]|nr:hypothetical protein [Nocardioides sp.]